MTPRQVGAWSRCSTKGGQSGEEENQTELLWGTGGGYCATPPRHIQAILVDRQVVAAEVFSVHMENLAICVSTVVEEADAEGPDASSGEKGRCQRMSSQGEECSVPKHPHRDEVRPPVERRDDGTPQKVLFVRVGFVAHMIHKFCNARVIIA
eukprot:CAMPEP_0175806820 /NCGR_PEP_ID=MMETSP0107_2-20121207/1395_1 /TAXON_ID=195067 ORGANISM="Goniomonas pacifica, Strain CCMP1869" /NCGR_SAMPLE_ID=MMETSP0107_2 /ASSEMBLY_ACC=CAM_ASM_000203 /LENGTH=151 /DNA_ID=CAMNT_0017118337 /DNA_START=114 /DNA_END=570 /DNA_ORIENTATION=+